MSSKSSTKLQLFLSLANYDPITHTTRAVSTDEFVGKYLGLKNGNGGSWCRKEVVKKYKMATKKQSGIIRYLWNQVSKEEKTVKYIFDQCPVNGNGGKGNPIKYIKIFGILGYDIEKQQPQIQRTICSKIKKYLKHKPCCVCGNRSNLAIDHKNDMLNDPRVLNVKTQHVNDFQSLCQHCNSLKRQVHIETVNTGKRYSATQIPSLAIFGIDFTCGNETFESSDINAMVGTYWYDPVAFMRYIKHQLSH